MSALLYQKINIAKSIFTVGVIALLSIACNENAINVNIDANYQGYIYLLSTNLQPTNSVIEADTNGIAYVPEYCNGIIVNFLVNHKKIDRQILYIEDHQFYGAEFEVSYKTIYYPFYPRKRFDVAALPIETLVEQGKVDKTNLKSCKMN